MLIHEKSGVVGGFILSMIGLDWFHTPLVQTALLAIVGASVSFLVSRAWTSIFDGKKRRGR